MIGGTNKKDFFLTRTEIVPQNLSGQDNKKETFRMILLTFNRN